MLSTERGWHLRAGGLAAHGTSLQWILKHGTVANELQTGRDQRVAWSDGGGYKGNGHPGQGTANFLVGGLEFRETFTGRGYLSLILKDE